MYENTFFKNSQYMVLNFDDEKELQNSSCWNNNRLFANSSKRGNSRDETMGDLYCETYICLCYNIFIYLKEIFLHTGQRYVI